MKAAEISGVHATTKGLRHGFGVRGAMKQIPLNLIQSWMGHADPSTTAIYLAVKDEEERALIEKNLVTMRVVMVEPNNLPRANSKIPQPSESREDS